MSNTVRSLLRLLSALVVVTALGSACSGSVSVGGKSISKADVEEQTAVQLAAKLNQPKPTVTCPGDLKAEVGTKMDCELTVAGDPVKLPVHLTVDSVEGSTAHWNIEVGQAPGDKAAFCAANAALDKATSVVTSAGELLPIFKANQATLEQFKVSAPPEIRPDAEKLYAAATASISSGDASAFADPNLQASGTKVDAFCGQNSDGSPTSTTKAP